MPMENDKSKGMLMDGRTLGRRGFIGLAAAGIAAAATARPAAGGAHDGGTVFDVAIIGAGLAGLTAARDLHRAGCDAFVVLEARDRVGGRTFDHDLGGGRVSEAGGQWIGPGQTAIFDLARELGIATFPTHWQGRTTLLAGGIRATEHCDGGFGTDPALRQELEALAREVPCAAPWTAPRAAEFDALSFGDWLARKKLAPVDQISWNLGTTLTTGAPPSRISLLHYLSLVNAADCSYEQLEAVKGGAQETRIAGGAQALSLRMAESLGDRVRLATPVLRVENWDDGPVAIHTPTGVLRARSVIVALSPALCQQIAFDPPLPAKRQEMQRRWPAYAPMRKTAHVYKKPFWREKGLNGWIVQPRGPLLWAYDNSPQDASIGVINAFVNNAVLPSDPDTARDELSRIYAEALGEEALRPVAYHDHDWGKADRWSLSCTTPIPPGFLTRYGDVLRPAVGRLIWSGTETAEIWATSMDGAVRSGHRAALQALQAVGRAQA